MDYSLLLAVEKVTNKNKEAYDVSHSRNMNRHRFKSSCGEYIYHIAIIDYL